MGTRADFYVGRGELAEWLGSIGMDGYPDGWPSDPAFGPIIAIRTEALFREMVAGMLAACGSGTVPAQGWPWPWTSSRRTDYAYAFDEGRVWVACWGRGWDAADVEPRASEEADEDDDEDDEVSPLVPFPDMAARQRVTLGPRSGLLVISPRGPERGEE